MRAQSIFSEESKQFFRIKEQMKCKKLSEAIHVINKATLIPHSSTVFPYLHVDSITVQFLNFWTPKNCCNLPKIQTKRPSLMVFCQKDANGTAKSEQSDLGLHRLPRPVCPKTSDHYGVSWFCNPISCILEESYMYTRNKQNYLFIPGYSHCT